MDAPRLTENTRKRLVCDAVAAQLRCWACIEADGERLADYLQTQLTQDVQRLSAEETLHAALLTPQGKPVTELYLLMPKPQNKPLWLLVPKDRLEAAIRRLSFFSIGWKVRFQARKEIGVFALQGARTNDWLQRLSLPVPARHWLASAQGADAVVVRMPISDDGAWIVGHVPFWQEVLKALFVPEEELEALRILAGIPRFGVEWDETTPALFGGLWETDGVSFDKGCYVGQEIVSRMRWRGKVRKQLVRIALEDKPARIPCPIGDPPIGELRSAACDAEGRWRGLALMPREMSKEPKLACGVSMTVLGHCGWRTPDWTTPAK